MSETISETMAEAVAATDDTIARTVESMKQQANLPAIGAGAVSSNVKNSMEKMMKTAEEMMHFNQGNIEAMVKSGQIWATGLQDLSKQMAAHAQASIEDTMSAFKALTGVRTLKDAMDLQSSLARASLEKAVAETGRLTDASMRLAEQTYAPIGARVSLAVESFGKTV